MPIRVLDPTQPPEVLPAVLAPRRSFDRPLNLALLSNGKTNATVLLRLVKDELGRELDIGEVVEAAKESASTNAAEALLDQLVDVCDLALVAVGD